MNNHGQQGPPYMPFGMYVQNPYPPPRYRRRGGKKKDKKKDEKKSKLPTFNFWQALALVFLFSPVAGWISSAHLALTKLSASLLINWIY